MHILCWGIFILVNVITFYNRFLEFPEPLFYTKLGIQISIFYLNFSLLVPKLLLNNKILLYVFTSFIFIFLSAYLINNYFNPLFPSHFKLSENVYNERFRPKRGFFGPLIVFGSMLLFAVGTSIRLGIEWFKNEKVKKEKELQRVHTEISFLKAQLNPHFLFNSLNSIYSLANKKSDDTTEAIVTLAELMRYMIYESDHELVL